VSDEDPTKDLPSVPDTEPTMYTVMERLNGLDQSLTSMQESIQESADRRHAETNANFRKLDDKMDILNRRVLDSEANQVDLRRRIEALETKAS
jgi:septal ring factor EnvC (AmiA/AmiB activator)